MIIEILGGGCTKCAALKKTVLEFVAELDISAEVESVSDPERLAGMQVRRLPVLLVDGVQKAAGVNVGRDELRQILQK